MGIYAVSSLHIRHQMKDIAIRKVCGAEFRDIFRHYVKRYLILLATAGATGLTAAYYLSELFLDRFALQAAYPWYMYPLTVVILALLVTLPLYGNLHKAWRTDPNRYLQSE
jgi:ABC-type antimicrobial peptide transport system permease subunit